MTGELPTDEARISGLVEDFVSAFDDLCRSNAVAEDSRLVELQPQLFAKVTQSFVDFGNLVSSALPEIFEQSAQTKGKGSDPAAGEAVEALVDAVAEDADAHAGTVGSLAGALADHIETLPAPAPQLEQVLTAVRGIESYWREVAEQVHSVPEVLSDGDPGQVAELRALAPIWDRVADRIDQAQRSMEMPPATAGAPALKVIDGGKDSDGS
ncbi:MAG: hypothetical protein ACJ8ER_17550 [Allosphingosinicella sp.]